jgi:hypothetical protein
MKSKEGRQSPLRYRTKGVFMFRTLMDIVPIVADKRTDKTAAD